MAFGDSRNSFFVICRTYARYNLQVVDGRSTPRPTREEKRVVPNAKYKYVVRPLVSEGSEMTDFHDRLS